MEGLQAMEAFAPSHLGCGAGLEASHDMADLLRIPEQMGPPLTLRESAPFVSSESRGRLAEPLPSLKAVPSRSTAPLRRRRPSAPQVLFVPEAPASPGDADPPVPAVSSQDTAFCGLSGTLDGGLSGDSARGAEPSSRRCPLEESFSPESAGFRSLVLGSFAERNPPVPEAEAGTMSPQLAPLTANLPGGGVVGGVDVNYRSTSDGALDVDGDEHQRRQWCAADSRVGQSGSEDTSSDTATAEGCDCRGGPPGICNAEAESATEVPRRSASAGAEASAPSSAGVRELTRQGAPWPKAQSQKLSPTVM
ncbi:unnamed protein product, partial [Polarella glacialis]